MRRPVRTCLALAALASVAFGQAKSWRGWDTYHVIMWSTGAPRDWGTWINRLREIGFTAEELTAGRDAGPFTVNNFGFYVENLVSELAYLHSRKPLYDADWQGYTTTRDKKYLVRNPCFHDPDYWPTAKSRVQSLVQPYAGRAPLLHDLRDELSLGSFASPMDYCFGPHTLSEFRDWLKSEYGTLEALNAEWETQFPSWDSVMPMTTFEVKDRERAALAAGKLENYAPWSDHRAFMDLTFARTLDRFRGYIREIDDATPVGVEGTQMPSTWGGYDLWRMSQAIDWVEAYDIASSREVFRSFLPEGTPILCTLFGSDFPRLKQKVWWRLLHGDRGLLVWDDEESRSVLKDQDGMPVTDRGRGLAEIVAGVKPVAPLLLGLKRVDDRIAVHYSQASIRAHWMFDSREDRDTWPRRFSSYEATWSRIARVRDSFVRVIEDLGLQYNFVSYEQLENGELLRGRYRVLLLPQSVAMSEKECRAVEEFVRRGGTVIADNMTATMDARCRRLPRGQLDALFGIERTSVGWSASPVGGHLTQPDAAVAPLEGFEPDIRVTSGVARQTTTTNVPVVIGNRTGMGRTMYLNLDMHKYGRLRLTPPKGQAYTELFKRLLLESRIEAPVKVVDAAGGRPVPGVEVWRYSGNGGQYVAVMRNPEFNASSLAEAGYPDNAELEKTVRLRITVRGTKKLTDVRGGVSVSGNSIEMDLEPWSPAILKAEPGAVERGPRSGRPRPVERER